MAIRISSLDPGYSGGNLSLYPEAQDNIDILYNVRNNAETTLKQSLSYNGKQIIVDDASTFPDFGLVRVGTPAGEPGHYELIYYASRSNSAFFSLQRGFAGSKQNPWPIGSFISNSVMAEHHNAIKDAVVNIENNIGTKEIPTETSLNGILKQQEIRFLSPKAQFRAYPIIGAPPLSVRFQNFSAGQLIRYLWDFGDGTTSTDKSPTHVYQKEGIYTVILNTINSSGGSGTCVKKNYILVDKNEKIPFFYVNPSVGVSVQTNSISPTTFEFVDQTDGIIINRSWVFDDGTIENIDNPNTHTTTHQYQLPGTYNPSLLVGFSSTRIQRVNLQQSITVT